MKDVFKRALAIITQPLVTWQAIKAETDSAQELILNYAAPLALIPAIAALIGLSIVGIKLPTGHVARAPFFDALVNGVLSYVFQLLSLPIGAWIVSLLAPSFDSKPDFNSATKLVVYTMTPIWLLGALTLIPALGLLQIFGLYAFHLLYVGIPVLMDTPPDKVLWYTVAIIIASIFVSVIFSAILGGAFYGPLRIKMLAL
jgi:hypothetical protein